MNRILSFFLLIIVTATHLVGCGYTLQGSGSVLPPDVKKIYVPFTENDSTEGSLANLLTEALRDQFERFGVVEVTDSRLGADAELTSRIKSVKKTSRAVTNTTDVSQQFDTTVVIEARLIKKNGTQLWADSNLQVSSAVAASQAGLQAGSTSFAGGLTTDSSLARLDPRQFIRSQEQTALEQIALTAAQTIYNQSVAPDF